MLRPLLALASLTLALHAAEIQVAAAADLAQVEAPLGAAFAKKSGGGVTVRWITGASGLLANQAEHGAPFDVFLSASESYARDLVTHEAAIGNTLVIYAIGKVGLWSPNGLATTLNDLLKPAVLHVAIANPEHAPYGLAAKQALESAGLWKQLEPKLVYGENVRQALQFAESGNVEAVLTSWSLVHDKLGAVEVTAKYKPIRQAGVVLKTSHDEKSARAFLAFMISAEAQAILRNEGLGAPQ